MRTPEYYKLHPMGRVPVLEDSTVKIYESGAIVEYLLARYGKGRLQPRIEEPNFPDYLQWLHYAEGSIMQQINSIVVETILLPPERKNDVNVTRALKLLKIALLNVDNRLKDRDFLAGEFSGADIMTGHSCYAAKRLKVDLTEMNNLSKYIDRLLNRKAFKKAISL